MPRMYSQTPLKSEMRAEAIKTTARGRLDPELAEDSVSDVSRACRRIAQERKDSSRHSFMCERIFRSSMHQSRAVLPVLSTASVRIMDNEGKDARRER